MANRDELLREIDEMIVKLSEPITQQERSDGWTQESKLAMKKFFEDLHTKLLNNERIPPLSIPRGMDSWGVIGGDLLDKGAKISNKLREL